ncbi:MAG TPA: GNAT family N-acetyltransferase [Nocardioides sp.]|nr:GNAT family N-acetyltransferase [Nocardioides sp.]
MSRMGVVPRLATREDAPFLAELWGDVMRRVDRSEQVADLELVIKQAAASPEERIVVVEYDGRPAGAVFLRLDTMSPLNLEPVVQSIHPRVLDDFRRHGVGRTLMEAAATFAEENGVLHVATAVMSSSRDANRFMARLGLAPVATYRAAPTTLLRSRVSPPRAGADRGGHMRVLAARRSRRARAVDDQVVLPERRDPIAPE